MDKVNLLLVVLYEWTTNKGVRSIAAVQMLLQDNTYPTQ